MERDRTDWSAHTHHPDAQLCFFYCSCGEELTLWWGENTHCDVCGNVWHARMKITVEEVKE